MSSACRSSRCCVDAKSPVRASYKVLYKWPESDAAFANSVAAVQSRRRHELCHVDSFSSIKAHAPAVVDGYSCRQLYLRSYTFTKKETVPQQTRRCMRKLKDGAVFPIFSAAAARTFDARSESKTMKKNKLKSTLHSVFHSLLFCVAKVEVAD